MAAPLWWDNRYMLGYEAETKALTPELNPSVFIAVGALEKPASNGRGYEMARQAEEFYRKLKARNLKGLSLKLHVIEEANHETAFPTNAIQGLWWLFEA